MRIVHGARVRVWGAPWTTPIATARGPIVGRARSLLAMYDEDGRVGLGEAAPLSGFSSETLEASEAALDSFIASLPIDVGLPLDGACQDLLVAISAALRGVSPAVPTAVAAVESAVLDLVSKRRGVPVWRLLGEGLRAKPISALLTQDTPGALEVEARALANQGFDTLKLKIGARSLDGEARRLEAVRRGAPQVRLRIDANGGGGHALDRLVAMLVPFDPELVEEPAPLEALERGARMELPVALDESLLRPNGLARALALAESRVVRALVLKPALLGGVLEARRIANEAGKRGLEVIITHALDGPLGHALASQLALSLPEGRFAHGLAGHAGLERLAGAPSPTFQARVGQGALRPDALDLEHEGRGPEDQPYLVGASLLPLERSGLVPPALERALLAAFEAPRPARGSRSTALSILAAGKDSAGKLALIDESGVHHRFETLADRAVEVLRALEAARIVEGAIAIEGVPRFSVIVTALAALELEIPIVWIHPRAAPAERARILEETGATLVDPDALLGGATPTRPRSLPIGGGARPAVILYTSGTSGRPKGAMLGRQALEGSMRAILARLGTRDEDRYLLSMPLAHVGGFSILTRALGSRSAMVLSRTPRFDPRELAWLCSDARVTIASLVPTMLRRLLDEPSFERGSLRAILLGGAAASPTLLEAARARGLPVHTTYGMTETSAAITLSEVGELAGVGAPLDGVELRIGTEDMIEVRGPCLMSGYLGTGGVSSVLDPAGWFSTGDHGRLDAGGRLFVLARRTDLIVRGGENVYPAEVEGALEAVPGILRAAVFGVADELWGEVVCAAVVLEPDGVLEGEKLRARLREAIAGYKCPERVALVDALPETPSGKIDRAAVRALCGGRLVVLPG